MESQLYIIHVYIFGIGSEDTNSYVCKFIGNYWLTFLDLATFCNQYYTCFIKFCSVEADVRAFEEQLCWE